MQWKKEEKLMWQKKKANGYQGRSPEANEATSQAMKKMWAERKAINPEFTQHTPESREKCRQSNLKTYANKKANALKANEQLDLFDNNPMV